MADTKVNAPAEWKEDDIVEFFEQGILSVYQDEGHKYVVETDNFEGRIRIAPSRHSEDQGSGVEDHINVRFGYRSTLNGELAIGAFVPDLMRMSKSHIKRWKGFALESAAFDAELDSRWKMWADRYLLASWEVDNGPRYYLRETMRTINTLTLEVVGEALFKIDDNARTPNYPSAENNHAYDNAHRDLYGYVIDGLNKECIARIATIYGATINVAGDNTVKSLKRINLLPANSVLWAAFDTISDQRRRASHRTRPPAERFAAFDTFNRDLEACVSSLAELLTSLEGAMKITGENASDIHYAKQALPKIGRPVQKNFSICRIAQIKGKTVKDVEFGFRQDIEGVHQSEAIILYFTDGSILGIDTGSNAENLSGRRRTLTPEEFHVNISLQWVPARVETGSNDNSGGDSR